ncbi:MAG TPA: hypothetical protein VJ572_05685 [Azonexus sp.]|nr:hypothetical protein [Azonexus sp.]
MTAEYVASWVRAHPLTPIQVDCATAVMLKILDGKCKMAAAEKLVMEQLYDQVKALPGLGLGEETHRLIATARSLADDGLKNFIYEKRVLAETMITRPVMKGFKAMIREHGLLVDAPEEEGEAA